MSIPNPSGPVRLVKGKAQSTVGSCNSGYRLIKEGHLFIPHHAKDIRGASHMAPGSRSTLGDSADRGCGIDSLRHLSNPLKIVWCVYPPGQATCVS